MGARTQIHPSRRRSRVQRRISGLDSHGKRGSILAGRHQEAAVGGGVDTGTGQGRGGGGQVTFPSRNVLAPALNGVQASLCCSQLNPSRSRPSFVSQQ